MAAATFAMDFDHSKNTGFDVESSYYLDGSIDLDYFSPSSSFVNLPSDSPFLPNVTMPDNTYTYSPRTYTPAEGINGISPPQLSYTLSNGELSDSLHSGRHSRGSGSHSPPAHIPYSATVPRSVRYTPIPGVAVRASARAALKRKARSETSDDEDEEFPPPPPAPGSDVRRETIRKQRIESEQRRRDELRDGYSRLKSALPSVTQRSSKVSLLDRATVYIGDVKKTNIELEKRLQAAETEVHRLRNVNEALMLSTARHTTTSF